MTAQFLNFNSTPLSRLGLLSFYLFALFKKVWGLILTQPALALALTAPFLIDVFLYASYKSLDFGMLLLLIGTCQISSPPKERNFL